MLSRLSKPDELTHEWLLTNFKYQKPEFYARLFDQSLKGLFGVPPCHTKVGVIRNPIPGYNKWYVFQESNSACVLCSLSCEFFFLMTKFLQIFKR